MASGRTEQRRKSLVGHENLLHHVRVEDCVFAVGDIDQALREEGLDRTELESGVMVEDSAKYAGLQLNLHRDGQGATAYLDKRCLSWITAGGRGAGQPGLGVTARAADSGGNRAESTDAILRGTNAIYVGAVPSNTNLKNVLQSTKEIGSMPTSGHAAPDEEQSPLLNTKEIRLGTPVQGTTCWRL